MALTWVLPFSVLMGSLIALGRLGADRELLIIEASGISAPRLLPPILLFSAVATLLSLVLSVYASPWANRSLDATLEQLAREKPWATIQQGQVHEFGGWKLRAREVSPGGDRLEGVQIWSPEIGAPACGRASPRPTCATRPICSSSSVSTNAAPRRSRPVPR